MFIIGKVQILRHYPVRMDAGLRTGARSWMSHAVPGVTPLVVDWRGLDYLRKGPGELGGKARYLRQRLLILKPFHILIIRKAVHLHT